MKILYWLGILSLLIISCTNKVVYKQTVNLENGKWTYSDTVQFSFSIQDTTNLYRLALVLNHQDDYVYQNLYIKLHTIFPNQFRKEDIVSLELANKSGRWNGACRLNKCNLEIPLQEKTYFSEPGDYSILLEQYMREEQMDGINAIGLILSKID